MRRLIRYLLDHSLLLMVGAVLGLLWANLGALSYEQVLHFELFTNPYIGSVGFGPRSVDVQFLVNDVAMALFFAIAGKEVWEAFLPGGPLHDLRRAASPLAATLGGMAGPALIYVLGALSLGRFDDLGPGWAIPCATDIAFSYLVARFVFGDAHPAIPFLLLLAIADDALGLLIVALFYPVAAVHLAWLLLAVAAVLWGLALRRSGVKTFWAYLLGPGVLSWLGFALAGVHPALGLLPIIPTLPHAHSDLGIFMAEELKRHDTLSEFGRWGKARVDWILAAFGSLNAGVVLGAVGAPTALVATGLVTGKPIGIFAGGWLAARGLGLGLPAGMTQRDLVVVGGAASIGFTVALFVSVVAFPAGPLQDAAKMGALASIGSSVLTILLGRALGVVRRTGPRTA